MNEVDFRTLAGQIREQVGNKLDMTREFDDWEIMDLISRVVLEFSHERYLTLEQKHELVLVVFNSMRRLDILQPLLEDRDVTEIMVNGPDHIFIERNGVINQSNLNFESGPRLENVIQSIVSKVNRVVNESVPIVDARLQDGSRVNVVLPPVAIDGPVLTIRKFPDEPLSFDQMLESGTLTDEVLDFLRCIVFAKYNVFISGGTGSGKTTFLNALSNYIPESERVITIEDSAELRLPKVKNLVRLETRNANTEGLGEVTIRHLIKTSLRMRPDRIVIGEVRGAEAFDMLQALNTGHDGSLSTGHGNSPVDMISRLETMVLSAAPLPVEVIRRQIAAALDIIIHLGRLRDGSRRVIEISEITGVSGGEIVLNPLFCFDEAGEEGMLSGRLRRTGNKLTKTIKLQMAGFLREEKVME